VLLDETEDREFESDVWISHDAARYPGSITSNAGALRQRPLV
jgi:hypothetical protein